MAGHSNWSKVFCKNFIFETLFESVHVKQKKHELQRLPEKLYSRLLLAVHFLTGKCWSVWLSDWFFLCKNAIFLEYPVIDLINALTYFFLAVAGHAVEIQAGQQQSMVPTNKSIQIETVAKHVYNLQVKKDWNYCKAWSQLTDQNTLKLL